MNIQEAFDKVIVRFKDGKGQSMDDFTCFYTSTNGNHCAIGALLTEDELAKITATENDAAAIITLNELGLAESLSGISHDFLEEMQNAHDQSTHWTLNEFSAFDLMKNIASRWSLEYTWS